MDVVLSQTHGCAIDIDLREARLPVGVVRPIGIRVAEVPVLDAPVDTMPVRSRHDPHAVRVAHRHRSASPRHVPAHAVAGARADDRTVEDLKRPDHHLAPLVHELNAVRC